MNVHDRLRLLADSLPPGASVVLTKLDLQALAGLEDGSEGPLMDLRVEEVGEALDRAPGTVRAWCSSGKLPGAYRLRGREWRIPRGALQALRDGELPEAPATTDRGTYDLAAWRDEVDREE